MLEPPGLVVSPLGDTPRLTPRLRVSVLPIVRPWISRLHVGEELLRFLHGLAQLFLNFIGQLLREL